MMLIGGEFAQPAKLGDQNTIFYEVRKRGLDSAAYGWYLPYCRILHGPTDCAWFSYFPRDSELSVAAQMRRQILSVYNGLLVVERTGLHVNMMNTTPMQEYKINMFNGLLTHGVRAAADNRYSLVFIHLPVPHAPSIYNRKAGAISTAGSNSYLDGLAHADATLGELHRAMEAANLWERSTVLVSSDHWWRSNSWRNEAEYRLALEDQALLDDERDKRVPFLLKMPGQRESVIYDKPMNTVVSKELLLNTLDGKLQSPADVQAWLDLQPQRTPGYAR
jgi:hypothetical protein